MQPKLSLYIKNTGADYKLDWESWRGRSGILMRKLKVRSRRVIKSELLVRSKRVIKSELLGY